MVMVTVGHIVRAHGIRGDVVVDVRTDTPHERFAVGTVLDTEPDSAGPLTVEQARSHSGRWLVRFEGVDSRTAAEQLRAVSLLVEIGDDDQTGEPDEYFDHQLIGLKVRLTDGSAVGATTDVIHSSAHDLIQIRQDDGSDALVPFVSEIVTGIDLEAGAMVIDPPDGLLALGND